MILIKLMWYSFLLGGFAHCSAIDGISTKRNSISYQNKIENLVENHYVTNNDKGLDKVEVIINSENTDYRNSYQ